MNVRKIEKLLTNYLEDKTFEEFLEEFNITPLEVVELLFTEGMLDEDILDRMVPADV